MRGRYERAIFRNSPPAPPIRTSPLYTYRKHDEILIGLFTTKSGGPVVDVGVSKWTHVRARDRKRHWFVNDEGEVWYGTELLNSLQCDPSEMIDAAVALKSRSPDMYSKMKAIAAYAFILRQRRKQRINMLSAVVQLDGFWPEHGEILRDIGMPRFYKRKHHNPETIKNYEIGKHTPYLDKLKLKE